MTLAGTSTPGADAAEPGGTSSISEADREVIARQIGRPPRGLRAVAARDAAGEPTVVQTNPRLEDGTPFPTLYYLTSPRLVSAVSTLEAEGLMREMTDHLEQDAELAEQYRRAHESYLAERDAIESLGTDVSAGGMPDRVKCLHVHVAHALAKGPGVNPFGDQALELIAERWPES
ncbi:septum formation initiator family protein [Saccharopolyspora erythraea D]|nr:septum formation initiator family protein [Saccharopolyspora erythraea D]